MTEPNAPSEKGRHWREIGGGTLGLIIYLSESLSFNLHTSLYLGKCQCKGGGYRNEESGSELLAGHGRREQMQSSRAEGVPQTG